MILKYFRRGKAAVSDASPEPEYVYRRLFGVLDQERLGYGFDRHSEETRAHWSTAYALISCAESIKHDIHECQRYEHSTNVIRCAQWLLDNRVCASTSAPLWSLPYQRRIWDDKEAVIDNTAFTIPTCHAIHALLDIVEHSEMYSHIKAQALQAASDAAKYYVDSCFDVTENGMVFWYSPLKQHSYHVTNATAMVAGQLQRISNLINEPNLARSADMAISELLHLKYADSDGVLGWMYFGSKIPASKQDKNRTNDLLHEAFVCHGLMEYKRCGGSRGDEYEYSDLHDALCKYYRDGCMHEYSSAESSISRRGKLARALGVGHALYVSSRLELLLERQKKHDLSDTLYRELTEHYLFDELLRDRPNGAPVTHQVRVVSYVLLGLAEYERLLSKR